MYTFKFNVNGEIVTATYHEIEDFYPSQYNLTYKDITGLYGMRYAEIKSVRNYKILTLNDVRTILNDEEIISIGEQIRFNITDRIAPLLNGSKWHVRITKIEEHERSPFIYEVVAKNLYWVSMLTRRFTTLDSAMLFILNGFNENANIKNTFESLDDFFNKMSPRDK